MRAAEAGRRGPPLVVSGRTDGRTEGGRTRPVFAISVRLKSRRIQPFFHCLKTRFLARACVIRETFGFAFPFSHTLLPLATSVRRSGSPRRRGRRGDGVRGRRGLAGRSKAGTPSAVIETAVVASAVSTPAGFVSPGAVGRTDRRLGGVNRDRIADERRSDPQPPPPLGLQPATPNSSAIGGGRSGRGRRTAPASKDHPVDNRDRSAPLRPPLAACRSPRPPHRPPHRPRPTRRWGSVCEAVVGATDGTTAP